MMGDFHMYHVLDVVRTVEPRALDPAPKLVEWISRMEAIPSLKAYLAERPSIASGELGRPGSLIAKMAADAQQS